jgi:hypothetical protein
MKASVTELPFNSFLGIQISTEPSQLLRLPSANSISIISARFTRALNWHSLKHRAVNFCSDISVLQMASFQSYVASKRSSVSRLTARSHPSRAPHLNPLPGSTPSLHRRGVLLFRSLLSFTTNQERIRFPLRSSGSFNVCQQMPKRLTKRHERRVA